MNDETPVEEDSTRIWHYRWWWAVLVGGTLVANALAASTSEPLSFVGEVLGYTFAQLVVAALLTGAVVFLFRGLHKMGLAERITAYGWMISFSVFLVLAVIAQAITV